MADDDRLTFADGYGVLPDTDFDVSGLRKLSTVLPQFELVKVTMEVFFGLVGFVDFCIISTATLEGLLVHYIKSNYYAD